MSSNPFSADKTTRRVLRNLALRVRNLERRPAGAVYVDDQVLDADASTVTFEGFPPNATVLEITWNCWLPYGASFPTLMYVTFDNVVDEDYRWKLAGSIEIDRDSPEAVDGVSGGVGLFNDYEEHMWGKIRFPDYSRTPIGTGPLYIAEAAAQTDGTGIPDVWQAAGFADNADLDRPFTRITFAAAAIADDSSQNFAAGSRFTLTAY